MMLREIVGIRQHDGEPPRRWFTDEYWDLFVWERDGSIDAFQLCYGKPDSEHSLSWRRNGAYVHHQIDDGESHPGSHRTPILVANGSVDAGPLVDRFRGDSASIDADVAAKVLAELTIIARSSAHSGRP